MSFFTGPKRGETSITFPCHVSFVTPSFPLFLPVIASTSQPFPCSSLVISPCWGVRPGHKGRDGPQRFIFSNNTFPNASTLAIVCICVRCHLCKLVSLLWVPLEGELPTAPFRLPCLLASCFPMSSFAVFSCSTYHCPEHTRIFRK